MTYLDNITRPGQLQPARPGESIEMAATEGVDQMKWASQQALALSKLQMFSALAKKINDQP
jgi:hypothetical protein